MPKSYYNEFDRRADKLQAFIYGQMKLKHLTQEKMADELGMSRQSFGYNLSHLSFNPLELMRVFNALEVDEEEVGRLLCVRKKYV